MDELLAGPLVDDLDQPLRRTHRRLDMLAFILHSKSSALSLLIIIVFVIVAILAPLLAGLPPILKGAAITVREAIASGPARRMRAVWARGQPRAAQSLGKWPRIVWNSSWKC